MSISDFCYEVRIAAGNYNLFFYEWIRLGDCLPSTVWGLVDLYEDTEDQADGQGHVEYQVVFVLKEN